jgi:hypothetical protein
MPRTSCRQIWSHTDVGRVGVNAQTVDGYYTQPFRPGATLRVAPPGETGGKIPKTAFAAARLIKRGSFYQHRSEGQRAEAGEATAMTPGSHIKRGEPYETYPRSI